MDDDNTKYVWIVSVDDVEGNEIKHVCSDGELAKQKWEEERVILLNQAKGMQKQSLAYWGYELYWQLHYFAFYQYYHNLTLDNVNKIEFYGERPIIRNYELI